MLREITKALQYRSEIQNIDFDNVKVVQVPFLPQKFNGIILFERPQAIVVATMVEQMQGMDNKYNGHPWCVVKTTHIKKNSYGLNFRQVACVGHLHCAMELNCPSFSQDGKPNEVH